MSTKNYVGIACTGHENALAIVNGSGEILFAESIERYIQTKRALNTPADDPIRVPRLLEAFCDLDGEFVVARSWSRDAGKRMKADAARMFKAIAGCDPSDDREWIQRVMFHVGLWDQLVAPNYQLAGTGVAGYCARTGRKVKVRDYPHHLTHAAYASFTSPFDDAVCAIFDGYGEGESYGFFIYRDGSLSPLEYERSTKNLYGSLSSLGMYYGHTACGLFGFPISNGEEWKVMGLAPYGRLDPELAAILKRHVYVDGLDLVMDTDAKGTYAELRRYAKRADQTFEDVADVAYTLQQHFCDLLSAVFGRLRELNISENLVFGGGCALNSSFNGSISERTGFRNVYIPPAPSDDGNAVGAALLALKADRPKSTPRRGFHTPYLGSKIVERDLQAFVGNGRMLGLVEVPAAEVARYVAGELAKKKIVAWVQGSAEFGPRALGNRSILADPRDPEMKGRINAVVKFREGFRPFAPAILDEYGDAYFENYVVTPYMERTLRIRPEQRSSLAAVCHRDGTGRLQSVRHEWNPCFHDLISAFFEETGVPVLLNTSLNVMGKPIVHTAGDAFNIYLSSGIDILVIGDRVFSKSAGNGG